MANPGYSLLLDPARRYEDEVSLKKNIQSKIGTRSLATDSVYEYESGSQRERTASMTLTTTGTEAEFESGSPTAAIAQIGSAHLTVKLYGDADNAKSLALIYTMSYVTNKGTAKTATATGTATLNGTKVAWVPTVTDFYACTAFSVSAANDTVTAYVATDAGAIYGTISVNTTAATQAQLSGVGHIYIKGSADHADADNKVGYLCYETPWGEVKYGIGTLGADSDEEVTCYEATDDGDGTTTVSATAVILKDFYSLVWWNMSAAATANAYFTLGDSDHNSNGGGGDLYAAILTTQDSCVQTRVRAPFGWHTWISKVHLITYQGDGSDAFTFNQYFTPDADGFARLKTLTVGDGLYEEEPCILLKEGTDAYFTIADIDAACIATLTVRTLQVKYNA